MRPLAVLILVAGAVAALAFAFLRLQGEDDPGGTSQVARPAAPGVVQAGELPVVDLIPDAGPIAPSAGPNSGREVVAAPEAQGDERWNNYLAGIVLDPAGQPLAGAKVELVQGAGGAELGDALLLLAGGSRKPALRAAETKEEGTFRFDRLEPGNQWSLRVAHPAYQNDQVGPIDVPEEGGVQESIQLEEGFVLFGRVVAAGSQLPVEGAQLLLEDPAAAFYGRGRDAGPAAAAVTDDNGNYELRNVVPQSKLLVCVAEGFATQINQRDMNVVGATERRKQVDFVLEEGRIIAGRVLAPDGSGVAGLRVDALGSNSQSSSRGTSVTDKGGEFLVQDVGEGRYSLRLDPDGLAKLNYHADPIQASAGDSNVEIRLLSQGGLMGVVRSNGGPVSRFTVTVRRQHPTNRAFGNIEKKQQFRSDNGEFRVEGLNQGTYVVQVDAKGFATSFSDPAQVEQGRVTPDVVVDMTEGGVLSGQVVDTYTKEPIAGARISTFDNNHIDSEFTNMLMGLAPTGLTKAETTTDADGRFELPLILPDSYQVRVEKRGYTGFTTNDVAVLEGQATDLGTIALSKGGVVRGTAFLADGQLAAGVEVSLTPLNPEVGSGSRTRADAEGRFVLQNVPAGRYKLQASRPAKATESPFQKLIDMRNSEIEIAVLDGQELEYDLRLSR